MKITISKTQWESIGKQAGWTKKAQLEKRWFIETYIDGQQMLGSDGTSILKSMNNLGDAVNDQIQRIKALISNVKPYIADAKKIVLKVVERDGTVIKTFDVTEYVLGDASKKRILTQSF